MSKGASITVGTSATLLFNNATSDPAYVFVANFDTASVFLGDSTVAVSGANKGYELKTGVSLPNPATLDAGETLYAVSVAGGARVDILATSTV